MTAASWRSAFSSAGRASSRAAMMPCTVSGRLPAGEAPVAQHAHVLLGVERVAAGAPEELALRVRHRARPARGARRARRAVSTSESGRSDSVGALALPPPQPGRRSSSSGRARADDEQRDAASPTRRRWSTKSSMPSSAQCRSSKTSTSGAARPAPRRTAARRRTPRCGGRPRRRLRRRARPAAAGDRAPTSASSSSATSARDRLGELRLRRVGGVGLEHAGLRLRRSRRAPRS